MIITKKFTVCILTLMVLWWPIFFYFFIITGCWPNCKHFYPPSLTTERRIKEPLIRIIHQSWKTTTLPGQFEKWARSWKRCFPNWKYKLWTDEDNRDFIRKYYAWFLPVYDAYPHKINRADAVRYFYMYHYGGIYADLDDECLRPFDHLLYNKSVVLGAMNGSVSRFQLPEGYTQNSFMYSTPKHPLWLHVIDFMMNRVGYFATAEHRTGPVLLMKAITDYRMQVGQLNNDIKVYEARYFNPFSWYENSWMYNTNPLNWLTSRREEFCKAFQMSVTRLENCKSFHYRNGAYVLQYHAHSWGES